jgi:hypothetical protein
MQLAGTGTTYEDQIIGVDHFYYLPLLGRDSCPRTWEGNDPLSGSTDAVLTG